MDLLAASINTAVIAIVGILLAWQAKGRFEALERKIGGVESRLIGTETRLDARIDRMEARLDVRIDTLQSSMDAMRSDLTQVALAVGVRRRAQSD